MLEDTDDEEEAASDDSAAAERKKMAKGGQKGNINQMDMDDEDSEGALMSDFVTVFPNAYWYFLGLQWTRTSRRRAENQTWQRSTTRYDAVPFSPSNFLWTAS